VVDDFADNREMYSEYLSFSGYDVIEARNGKEAVDAAQQRQPDIIIMDLSLPVMDGWEATRRLKADESHPAHPGGRAHRPRPGGALQGREEAGCDSFLAKPCLPDQLVAEIRRMLEPASRVKAKGQVTDAGIEKSRKAAGKRPQKEGSQTRRSGGEDKPPPAAGERQNGAPATAADARGKYVYCIIQASDPLRFGPLGIGRRFRPRSTRELQGHRRGGERHADRVHDPTRENVLAHEAVNETVMRKHT